MTQSNIVHVAPVAPALPWWVVAMLVVWSIIILSMSIGFDAYAVRSGDAQPGSWATSVFPDVDDQQPWLVMTVHPECACTELAMASLAESLRDQQVRVSVYVAMPETATPAQRQQCRDVWQVYREYSGQMQVCQVTPAAMQAAGAYTSGEVWVYGPHGQQWFRGGVTPARGHVGNCLGLQSVIVALRTSMAQSSAPVFGCALGTPTVSADMVLGE